MGEVLLTSCPTLESAVNSIVHGHVKGLKGTVSYFEKFSACEILSAVESVLGTEPNEMELVNAVNFVTGGLSVYQKFYLLLRIVPKIILPAVR
jgi:hypothetical protein